MKRRTKITIAVVLAVILLAAIIFLIYSYFFNQPEPTPEPTQEPQVEEQEEPEEEPEQERTISDQIQEEEQNERNQTAGLQSLTKTFVERYGSYSNDANFANLEDVMPLMTEGLAGETQTYIEQTEPPEEYYGVTTRVVSINVENRDEEEGTATIRATTQREEAEGTPQNTTVRYQDVVVEFVNEEGTWKVSDITWQ